MGGGGASSGVSKLMDHGRRGGNKHGTQYRAVLGRDGKPLVDGNVKFVEKTAANEETLMETMTRGRVYAYVNTNGELASIVYFDNNNRRSKQIDLLHMHPGVGSPHTHRGYFHDEYTVKNGPTKLTKREIALLDRVIDVWKNRGTGR